MKTTTEITCYGQVRTRGAQHEWYETSSRDAGRRARQLRKLGFVVSVESMGSQVTGVGLVKMTLVTILADHDVEVPGSGVRVERMP